MKLLGVCVTLGLLSLSSAMPSNYTMAKSLGHCAYLKHLANELGGFVPMCDPAGNFIAYQCWNDYCWCVDIYSGHEVLDTKKMKSDFHYDCGYDYYCPYEWTQYGKRCFLFVDSPKTWIEAEAYCLYEGGNLASIHSYEENHFVQGLTRGDTHDFPLVWIGGFDAIKDCFWMWSDGSKFMYEKWSSEYKMEMKHDDCLMMNYGYEWDWYCDKCNKSLPFVCAKSNWKNRL